MRYRDPARRSLPLAEWPAADQAAWTALLAPGDILYGDGGPGAEWAPSTRETVMRSYGNWLGWLTQMDCNALHLLPASRVTPARASAWVTHLTTIVAPRTTWLRFQHLFSVTEGIEPDRDWTWLRHVVRRLDRRAVAVRPKRDRLLSADEIVARGLAMTDEADRAQAPQWQDAQMFRDGLMLALLASRPLRLANFEAIEIGRHLVPRVDGFELRIAASETKAGREIEVPVPDRLVLSLTRYLQVYRPLLRERAQSPSPTDRLWISCNGRPMGRAALYCRIVTLTEREFGRRLNPHVFRDCAATSIALADPEHVRITRHVLGHATLRTAERHYDHANAVQAARLYQAHVGEMRTAYAHAERARAKAPVARAPEAVP